jgi:hypothetical protein
MKKRILTLAVSAIAITFAYSVQARSYYDSYVSVYALPGAKGTVNVTASLAPGCEQGNLCWGILLFGEGYANFATVEAARQAIIASALKQCGDHGGIAVVDVIRVIDDAETQVRMFPTPITLNCN